MRSSVRSRLAPPISTTCKARLFVCHTVVTDRFSVFQNSRLDRRVASQLFRHCNPRCWRGNTSAAWTCIGSSRVTKFCVPFRSRSSSRELRIQSLRQSSPCLFLPSAYRFCDSNLRPPFPDREVITAVSIGIQLPHSATLPI